MNLRLYKSTNGGDSYGDAQNGLGDTVTDLTKPAHSLFIAPFVMDSNAPTTLIAGGESLWRTTDSAGSWASIRGAQGLLNGNSGVVQCSSLAIANTNSNRVWAGYNDGRLSRTDGASVTTWTDVQGATMPRAFVTSIAINPKNENEVFVALGGYANNTLWYTSDSGTTWQLRHGLLPAVQINTVTFHPGDTRMIYVGTDVGIFASEDKGATWSRAPLYAGTAWNNEGPANVEVDQLFWQGDSLVVATFGRGMWRTMPYRVLYVDKNNPFPFEFGIRQLPYKTVQKAIDNATDYTLIVIIQGDYPEGFKHITKKIRFVSESGGRVH